MRSHIPLVAASALLGSSGCGAGCGDADLPVEDVCAAARAGQVAAVEVGKGLPAVFMPLADDDVAALVEGDAGGSPMLPVRFRLTGADVPACVDQRTTLTACAPGCDRPEEVARSVAPLRTYLEGEEGSGVRETAEHFLILSLDDLPEAGTRLELAAEVAGRALAVRLWVASVGEIEVDAGPDPVDAAPPDAAPP